MRSAQSAPRDCTRTRVGAAAGRLITTGKWGSRPGENHRSRQQRDDDSYNLTGLSADCLPARGIAIDDRVDGYRFLGSIAVEAGGASPFTTPALRADGADGLFCPGQPRILRLEESCM